MNREYYSKSIRLLLVLFCFIQVHKYYIKKNKYTDYEKLCSLYGQINLLSTETKENVLSLNRLNTSAKELLNELVATIQTGHEIIRSVTCHNEEMIWTSEVTSDIKCLNIEGSLLRTIQTKSGKWPNDIAVDSDGKLLYSYGTRRTVSEEKIWQIQELIRLLGWRTSQLGVTSTGNLLPTMHSGYKTVQSCPFFGINKETNHSLRWWRKTFVLRERTN